MTPQEALARVIEHREIFHDEMLHLMRLIMTGELSPVMTAALLTGLRQSRAWSGKQIHWTASTRCVPTSGIDSPCCRTS